MSARRLFILFLISVLLLGFSFSAPVEAESLTSEQKEEKYLAAVLELEAYLESGGRRGDPAAIADEFDALYSYMYSKGYRYYAQVLEKIGNEEYDDELYLRLEMLEGNAEFREYLEENRKNSGSSIGTVAQLKAYAAAREAEHRGKKDEAAACYKACLGFFNADERYENLRKELDMSAYEEAMKLFNGKDYAGAWWAFSRLEKGFRDREDVMAAIESMLGYTPRDEKDNPGSVTGLKAQTQPTQVTLTWSPAAHATEYEVAWRESREDDWTVDQTVTGTTATVTGLKTDTMYVFLVTAVAGKVRTEGAELAGIWTPAPTPTPVPRYKTGDIVLFGHYPQSTSGKDETPIEWIVLEADGTARNMLLISLYGLDMKPYNETDTYTTWEKCTLRTWLNREFYDKAFSTAERRAILMTKVDNGSSQGCDRWNTDGGSDTDDRIFLLSYAEANKYFGVAWEDGDNIKSRMHPTDYAVSRGAFINGTNKTVEGTTAGQWWLRSPGVLQNFALYVYSRGSLTGGGVNSRACCVRPALWISLDAGIF